MPGILVEGFAAPAVQGWNRELQPCSDRWPWPPRPPHPGAGAMGSQPPARFSSVGARHPAPPPRSARPAG